MTEREDALEEAAKVAEKLAEELARLKGSGDRRVQIGSHLETCATIATAIRALKSSSPPPKGGEGWRDIESAPKDGTEVLVYVPRRLGALYAGASNQTGKQWWSRNLGDVQPTHWMPLPAAPDGKAMPQGEMGNG